MEETFVPFRGIKKDLKGRLLCYKQDWTGGIRAGISDLQGTSMEGPIPSTISLLTNLTELRISDLTGSSASFPDLQNMTSMIRLVVRGQGTGPRYGHVMDLVAQRYLVTVSGNHDGKKMGLLLNIGGPDRLSRVQMAEAVDHVRGYDTTFIKPASASSLKPKKKIK